MTRAILTFFLACAGCGAEPDSDAGTARPTVTEPSGAGGSVFASGPGVRVTVDEIEARVRRTGESPSHAAQALLADALLAAAAEKRGLGGDAEAVRTRRQVLAQRVLEEEVEAKVRADTIPRDDVEALYRKNLRQYVHGEEVRVEHFLARLEKRATPEEVTNARSLAETVLASARTAPAEPLETHRAIVPRGARIRIEEIPPFSKGSIYDPAFEAAALPLARPNDLSGVVRSDFGFHVIKLLERLPASNRSLAEVEAQIREGLVPAARRRRLQELIAELGNRGGVEVDPSALAALE